MRRDPAHVDRQDDDQDQRDGQRDASGQCLHRARGLALVDEHVIEAGAEVPHDDDQEGDDQQGFQRVVHGDALGGGAPAASLQRDGCIIAADGQARVSHRRNMLFSSTLFSSRLSGWVLALAAMTLFAGLGHWQLGRKVEKQAQLDAAQRVLSERVPHALSIADDPQLARGYDWAAGAGRFVDAPAVLLDNQQRAGRIGVRIYRLFQPASGTAPLLVELGWLPVQGERVMPDVPRSEGSIRLEGLLSPPPSQGLARATAVPQPNGTLLATGLDADQLRAALHADRLAPRVLRLDPRLPIGYARDLDILPNTLPPQKHLGYAVQWFALALAVLATALILTFRKAKE